MVGKSLSHYKILQELGRGGMGIVYKAEDTKLDRTVAIKVLPSAALASEDDRARFYREAKAAAQLHHPHIASVFEIDEAVPEGSKDDDLRPLIAMEYIEGRTLDAKIKDGPLKLDDAVRIASEIASALEAAHKKDIVHRDIKSQNVMLTETGSAKVLDFGLAQTAQSTKLTRMGSTLGTIAYMSPEQARSEEVDRRTDIWSLGVVLYEMIAGKHAFPGDYEQAAVYSILNEEPEPLTAIRTGVPMGVEWIVSKCLAKNADARYQNATDLLVDLKNIDLAASGMSRVSVSSTGVDTSALSASSTIMSQSDPTVTESIRKIWPFTALVAVVGLVLGIVLRPMIFDRTSEALPVIRSQLNLPNVISPLQADITPDDRYLFYVTRDPESGSRQLARYDFETGDIQNIEGTEGVYRPVASLDGRWIAYSNQNTNQLWRMPVSGGEPTEIRGASVSNNESLGAYTSDGELMFGTSRFQTINVVESSGQIRPLAQRDTIRMNTFLVAMTASPTGSFYTWGDFTGDGVPRNTWILQNGESEARRLMDGAYIHKITTSGHALFIRGHIETPEQTLAVPINLKTGNLEGAEVPLGKRSFPAAVSPSGLLVFEDLSEYDASERRHSLYRVDSSGNSEVILALPGGIAGHFSIARNGVQILVELSTTAGLGEQLYLFDLSNGSSNPVSQDGTYNTFSWGAEDEYMYFDYQSPNSDALWELYRRRADLSGVNEPVFADSTYRVDIDIGSDEDMLVFKNDEQDLWIHQFSTDSTYAIVDDEVRQDNPKISSDSRYVVFLEGGDQCGSVRIISTSGRGQSIEISNHGCHVDWSPDDKFVYYQIRNVIFRIPVTTDPTFRQLGSPEPVFVGPTYLDEGLLHVDISADGSLYVMYPPEGATQATGTIWLVHNWFEELNRIAPRSE